MRIGRRAHFYVTRQTKAHNLRIRGKETEFCHSSLLQGAIEVIFPEVVKLLEDSSDTTSQIWVQRFEV